MLLLDLTLCCFQMCIPSNETHKRRQSDLYVLEAMGGGGSNMSRNPSGPPQGALGNGVFYREAFKAAEGGGGESPGWR